MGVKRKMERRGKVIKLHDEPGVAYPGGIHALAEETGLPMDELFHMMMALCLSARVLPVVVGMKDGTNRAGFMVSRNERDTRRMREMMAQWTDSYLELDGAIEKTRDRIFGRWLDRVKDGG